MASAEINIGKRLRLLRENSRMTQEEVGKSVGVTKATINRYETGEIDIKRTAAIKLGELFSVSPAYIMGWTDEVDSDVCNNRCIIGDVASNTVAINNGQQVMSAVHPTSKMELDLLRIFNAVDGKTQTQIMAYMYDIEEKAGMNR